MIIGQMDNINMINIKRGDNTDIVVMEERAMTCT